MLAPEEFTVGTVDDASPLTLILPRNQYEERVLIGQVDGAPVAVFLTGQLRFHYFISAGHHHWRGLIIPDVRIEVDETSLFDADGSTALGSVVRTDTRLVVRCKSEHFYGSATAVTLHDKLPSAGELRAGFTKWQLVIGFGHEKRILAEVDLAPKITT